MIKPPTPNRTDYLAPPEVIQNLTFGLNIQYADAFWLRAIQDFEFCEAPQSNNQCTGKSWLYKILNVVVILDKNFYDAFYYGALALTVIISDYDGASEIFNKAVVQFPKNWPMLYTAGYHALVEEKNKTKAAKLYFEAGNMGAPDWVRMMAGKLAVDGGDLNYAEEILVGMIKLNDQPAYVERLKLKLTEVRKKK